MRSLGLWELCLLLGAAAENAAAGACAGARATPPQPSYLRCTKNRNFLLGVSHSKTTTTKTLQLSGTETHISYYDCCTVLLRLSCHLPAPSLRDLFFAKPSSRLSTQCRAMTNMFDKHICRRRQVLPESQVQASLTHCINLRQR